MSLLRQFLFALLILVLAGGGWLMLAPSGQSWLDGAGLSRLSLAPRGEAAPAPGAGARGWGGGAGGPNAPVTVTTRPAALEMTAEIVTAIGNGRALRTVTLSPEVSGRVTAVLVTAGQKVEPGQPVLELEKTAQEIALRRADLLLADARAAADRARRLAASGAMTELQQTAAELAEQTAALAQREAQIELSYRTLVSPIAGHVGFIEPEVGDQLGTSTVVTQIDDRSRILVDFRLPERLVARLSVADRLEASPLSSADLKLRGQVHAIDTRVDQASRSFRVQAELANTDDSLRPGMAFRINMSFAGEPRIAVDPLAVQWNGTGSYVWVVRGGLATSVPVTIQQRTAGRVLVRGDLVEGEGVVVEGVTSLREGRPVTPAVEPTVAASPDAPSAAPRSGRDI